MTETTTPDADPACLSLRWAHALLGGLLAGGVRRLVMSPGSRSTPLVLAAERLEGMQLTAVVDERSAAFCALGMARASGEPVALLCTSGSAPAHWHPAVVEAAEWGVPLVLLSADRPPGLVARGANQTTEQHTLFQGHLRAFHDPGLPRERELKGIFVLGRRAAATSRRPDPGPVHINLPFDEPLVPRGDCALPGLPPASSTDGALLLPDEPLLQQTAALMRKGRGLILCGPADHAPLLPALEALCRRLDVPVLADPLSGLRFGATGDLPLVSRYDALLRNPRLAARLRPDWILRLGRPPVSRLMQEWMAGIPLLLVDPRRRWQDPEGDCRLHLAIDPVPLLRGLAEHLAAPRDRAWSGLWRQAEAHCGSLADTHLDRAAWFEGRLLRALLRLLPDDSPLLVANSLPVRQLDTWSGTLASPLRVFGNRGASGIDGQASTLAGIGMALARPAFGMVGDLSLFHDLGGLDLVRRSQGTLLVIDNGGGRIFDYLPQQGLPGLRNHWRTPVDLDLESLCQAFGIGHHPVSDEQSLGAALEQPSGAGRLIEVRVDGELSRRETLAYWDTVARDPLLTDLAPKI